MIEAIFETKEFHNLYKEHEYDDQWFDFIFPNIIISGGEVSDPDGDFAELTELVRQWD